MKKLLFALTAILLLTTCKKSEPPPPPVLAILSTEVASSISLTTAVSGGNITSDGGASITDRGICYSTTNNQTTSDSKAASGSGIGSFTANMTGLTAGTTYYVRAYAISTAGTAYGNVLSFTTLFEQVAIGTQVWMLKNLDVSTYRNGDLIPKVTDANAWGFLTTGAWSWYNNDSATYAATYGKLYNWYAVNDPRGLAPAGWHVPIDGDWATLSTFLGGGTVAGGQMKETGTTHWQTPNTGATNSSGFKALPGGFRNLNGTFSYIGNYGYWWYSTAGGTNTALIQFLYYDGASLSSNYLYMADGLSVRCIKD